MHFIEISPQELPPFFIHMLLEHPASEHCVSKVAVLTTSVSFWMDLKSWNWSRFILDNKTLLSRLTAWTSRNAMTKYKRTIPFSIFIFCFLSTNYYTVLYDKSSVNYLLDIDIYMKILMLVLRGDMWYLNIDNKSDFEVVLPHI